MFRSLRWIIYLALGWSGLWVWFLLQSASAQTLPQQVGAINDYAAVLGGKQQRQPLNDAVNQLQQQHDISFVLLFSERDPFANPDRYASEIRRSWKIPDTKTVFALFLKRDQRWSFLLWRSSDLSAYLDENTIRQLRKRTEELAQKGHLRQASLEVVSGMLKFFDQDNRLLSQVETSPSPIYVVSGTTLGLLVLVLLWRWLRSFCPHCAKPLHAIRRSGRRLRYCPHCGYNRG